MLFGVDAYSFSLLIFFTQLSPYEPQIWVVPDCSIHQAIKVSRDTAQLGKLLESVAIVHRA